MNLRVHDYRQKVIYKKSSELDALTGIANRAACKRRIDEYLKNRDIQEICAMIVLDVDNFKQVNDKMGHSTGDKVLQNVANILNETFDETNIVGRFGGDEFLVFVTNVLDEKDVHNKCIQINDEMKKILNGNFDFSCSMGVCFLKYDIATQEELFRAADNALYEAKAFRKGTHVQHVFERSIITKEEMPLMVIIDDNQIDLEIMGIQFEDSFRIKKIASSIKALDFIEHNNTEISIILMDMVMPEMNGYEMLKKLKSKPSTGWIPVVAVSADEEVEETALSLGAEDMILKPIIPAIVKLRVANVMKKVRV